MNRRAGQVAASRFIGLIVALYIALFFSVVSGDRMPHHPAAVERSR